MLLEIESAYSDILIHGPHFSRDELQTAVQSLLHLVSERVFVSAFCLRFGYEPVVNTGCTPVDYVIDLDTHPVIKSHY